MPASALFCLDWGLGVPEHRELQDPELSSASAVLRDGYRTQGAGLDNTGKMEKSLMGNHSVPEGEHSHVCAWIYSAALFSPISFAGKKDR